MHDHFDMGAAWDQVSATYQRRHAHLTNDVDYGPWSPPESQLQLLGLVKGLQILDLGCGGGQACVALARQGAVVTGLDSSRRQLEYATQLATQAQVDVQFLLGGPARLAELPTASWDLVLSVYTLQYMAELPTCLAACQRLLRPTGKLIFSLDHPMRACFFDQEEQELTPYPSRSYFDHSPLRWLFPETQVWLHAYHYTIGEWVTLLREAGYTIERLVEPPPPLALVQHLWPEDDLMFPMRNLPHTMIVVASKDRTVYQR